MSRSVRLRAYQRGKQFSRASEVRKPKDCLWSALCLYSNFQILFANFLQEEGSKGGADRNFVGFESRKETCLKI